MPCEFFKNVVRALGRHKKLLGVITVAVVVKVSLRAIWCCKWRRLQAQRYLRQQPNVVYLYGLGRSRSTLGLNASCLKVEAFLRLHRIPHVYIFTMNKCISPTERLPCIDYNGKTTADSEYIIQRLIEERPELHGHPTAELTEDQTAQFIVIRRIVECSLHLHLVRHNMVNNIVKLTEIFSREFTFPVMCVKGFMRRKRKEMIKMLNAHGHGDLTEEQFYGEFLKDIQTLETFLKKTKFAVSDNITIADMSLFPMLYVLSESTMPCRAITYCQESAVIRTYVETVKTMLFPDAASIVGQIPKPTCQSFFLPPPTAS